MAIVREAVGVAAYSAGDYATALTELKAAARISGSSDYLPMIADCERGLGRPERALALASSPEASTLDRSGKVELLIVASGARRDLGQAEAAVLTLQVPALKSRAQGEWLARLRYAYADALLEVGRVREAREWFARSAEVDPEGSTDAQERISELDGITFDEIEEEDEPVDADGPAGPGWTPDAAGSRDSRTSVVTGGSGERGAPAGTDEPGAVGDASPADRSPTRVRAREGEADRDPSGEGRNAR